MANPAEQRSDDRPELPTRIPFAGPHPGTVERDWQSSAPLPESPPDAAGQRPPTPLSRSAGIPRQRSAGLAGAAFGTGSRRPAVSLRSEPDLAVEAREDEPQPGFAGPVSVRPWRSRALVAAAAAAVVVAGGLWWSRDPAAPATPQAAIAPVAVPTMRITAPGATASAGIGSGKTPAGSAAPKRSAASSGPASTKGSPTGRKPVKRVAPPAPGAAVNTSGRNLASGSRVTASSVEGPNWEPDKAVDGDTATRWSSQFSDPQWLTLDLGKEWEISEVLLHWENAHATAYRVEVSADGRKWRQVYSTADGRGGDVTVQVPKIPARLVRMYGLKRSTSYGYSLLDVEVR